MSGRRHETTAKTRETMRCPYCLAWVPAPHGRKDLQAHIRSEHAREATDLRRRLSGEEEGTTHP